jgi:predicted nucleic acid-binding protein
MDLWKAEIMAKVETQEDRKARYDTIEYYIVLRLFIFCRIMERAYALRDQRERIRENLVKEALDRQWRDACDDARTLDSEALLALCDKERREQMAEKARKKAELKNSENNFNDEWLEHVTRLENAEKEKDAKRRHLEEVNKDKLREQVIKCYLLNLLLHIIINISTMNYLQIQFNRQRKEQYRAITQEEDENEIRMVYTK